MPPKPPDENDQLRTGVLPADPFEGAMPMSTSAEDESDHLEAVEELKRQRVGSFLASAWERMRARGEGRERPIATPWADVNDALAGGIWPGLHVLVGATGSGKSQWALQLALHAALKGTPVLYVGLELGQVDLVARLVGLLTERKWSRLYLGRDSDGQTSSDELNEIADRHHVDIARLEAAPFHLEVCPPHGWSYEELNRKALAMRVLYPEIDERQGSRPILLVLDFLQLVASPEGLHEDLRERIGRAAYAGRAVARDLDMAVLLVSSTARDNYASLEASEEGGKVAIVPGKTPANRLVGLGKESGEVEYAADSVLVFVRGPHTERSDHNKSTTAIHIAVAKARAPSEDLLRRKGWLELAFNGGWFMAVEGLEGGYVPLPRGQR
jgi:replicative DNA helicase